MHALQKGPQTHTHTQTDTQRLARTRDAQLQPDTPCLTGRGEGHGANVEAMLNTRCRYCLTETGRTYELSVHQGVVGVVTGLAP